MTTEPNDLDVALDELHTDKKRLLKMQLRSIEEEIVERRLIAVDTALQVEDAVHELNNAMLNLTPAHENLPDVARKDRMVLEREKLDLTKEVREEQRDSWKDVQQLKQEERLVENDLLRETQHHKRTKDLL